MRGRRPCFGGQAAAGGAASGGFPGAAAQLQRRSLCPVFPAELWKNISCSTTFRRDVFTLALPLLPAMPLLLCFVGQKNNLNKGIKIVICVFEQGLFAEPHFDICVVFVRVF